MLRGFRVKVCVNLCFRDLLFSLISGAERRRQRIFRRGGLCYSSSLGWGLRQGAAEEPGLALDFLGIVVRVAVLPAERDEGPWGRAGFSLVPA